MTSATLPTTNRAARWFHALSDETRLEIVEMLSHGERCVCELQDALEAAQSRLSFHLKTLKDAGLVTERREGTRRLYRARPEGLTDVRAFLDSFWDDKLERLKREVERG